MTNEQMRQIMAEVCEKNNAPGLDKGVRISWNNRFTRRFADASYSEMRIRLSTPLWKRATEQEKRDTIAHEMCHIVAIHRFGHQIKDHGGEWRACMIIAGYKPERCHRIDRVGLKRTTKTNKAQCDCGPHMISAKKFKDIITKNQSWVCRKCKQELYIIGVHGR